MEEGYEISEGFEPEGEMMCCCCGKKHHEGEESVGVRSEDWYEILREGQLGPGNVLCPLCGAEYQ